MHGPTHSHWDWLALQLCNIHSNSMSLLATENHNDNNVQSLLRCMTKRK